MDLHTAMSRYLAADLAHTIGAYDRALALLSRDAIVGQSTLAQTLRQLTTESREYNAELGSQRYAARLAPVPRHPPPPSPATTNPSGQRARRWAIAERTCLDYYATVNACIAERLPTEAEMSGIRRALAVYGDADRLIGLRARFDRRQQFICTHISEGGTARPGRVRAKHFWTAHLSTQGLIEGVLEAGAEAHWLTHCVAHRRSGPVGAMMERTAAGETESDHTILQRAKGLNTFVFSIALAMPWIFAVSEQESSEVRRNLEVARTQVQPSGPLWIARQMMLLALYRRAFTWALLGEHARAYNDYWKMQQVVRLTKAGARSLDSEGLIVLDVLDALAEYRIGELYRADHDYRQALVHCCRSQDRILSLPRDGRFQGASVQSVLQNSHWRVGLLLSTGKAFYEQGQMKRACKWYLKAWEALDDVVTTSGEVTNRRYPGILTAEGKGHLQAVSDWLTSIEHEPDFIKDTFRNCIKPVVESLDAAAVPQHLEALAADILDRLGHTLMVLRLSDDDLAERCLRVALDLDPSNLLVRSDMLQLIARGKILRAPRSLPAALQCWPSGGSLVDQVIRVAEHHTRRRVNRARKPSVDHESKAREMQERLVSRALLNDFLTHTDSIHVRSALAYQFFAPNRRKQSDQREKASIEFVCLRRYGSSSPFMARPASVPAIGGGYLLRLLGTDAQYNIIVDPGEGVVANLYRVGFALTDIDMIIVTHDHPDHLAGLDPILALLKEYETMMGETRRPKIYGNASVVARYSFDDLPGYCGIEALPCVGRTAKIDAGRAGSAVLTSLPTEHKDLGGNNAVGFMFAFTDRRSRLVGTLTFMSDTKRQSLRDPVLVGALNADVVVAHISNASVGELGRLAFPQRPRDGESRRFEDALTRLSISDWAQAQSASKKLSHALGLRDPVESEHLLLAGVLKVAQEMTTASTQRSPRVLIVGEFREQLGPFRGKIAQHVKEHTFETGGHVALTADIGLRLRIDEDGIRVLCSKCALNNDRLPIEQYHDPRRIREVCIKGDFEGMRWNCSRHDPGAANERRGGQATFLEHTAGYDVFGPGGLFHG